MKNNIDRTAAKHRSFLPTLLNLLVDGIEPEDVSELSYHAVMSGRFMEDHSAEIYDTENSRAFNTRRRIPYGFSCACGKSHRTEDISIRQNEDGSLSHYCPLDEEQDGEKDENEDYPDQPMQLDYVEVIKSGYDLHSDDIPFLMAEKPFGSESEENIVSDVDASTSMIYALTQNLVSTKEEDISMQFLRQAQKHVPSLKTMDEKTMAAWVEDSNDDLEDYLAGYKDEERLPKPVAGDDSDMEEFEENSEGEKENENNPERTRKEAENDGILKNRAAKNEPSNDKTENTPNNESSNKLPAVANIDRENVEKSREETSDNKTAKEDKSDKRDETKIDECTFHSTEDQEQIDALKAEVQKAILYATITPNDGGNFQNPMRDLLKEVIEFDGSLVMPNLTHEVPDSDKVDNTTAIFRNEEFASEPNVNRIKYLATKKTENKIDDSSSNRMHQNVLLVDSCTKLQTEAPTKPVKGKGKANLSMEPVAMNLSKPSKTEEPQPDLATALRFMTEVYHSKDDDDLYFDTLSVPDMQAEVIAREKSATVITDSNKAIEGQESTDRSIRITTANKSSTFEPVLIEEQRDIATRSRNKFTKFLKSFKKKLAKKA